MVGASADVLPRGVQAIERCYESGRYFTAYRAARDSGLLDVRRDTDPHQAVLAGRVMRSVGAPRRARKVLLETWRRHRGHPRAAIYAIYELLNASPLAALDWIERIGDLDGATDEERSDWLCARVLCLAELRDFAAAERAWSAARDCHADAWTWCASAWMHDARDRFDDALAATELARELSPWYRPAIEIAARVLVRRRRADDARALLVEATQHLEAASTHLFLAILQRDAGELDAALSSLHHAVTWSPAMERELHDQLAAQLGHVHYLRGEVELAVHLMRQSQHELGRALADRIAASSGRRHKLAVPHVPQHHNTCAPATLTAIAELWGETVDHAEIAEQICHDGTPAGNERRWAEERGFVARQFTVTWDAAHALIDAGIPFALTTSFTLGAHLQPVAGYDERRRSLLVPDPSAPALVELDWDRLATSQAPFGPRGMAFVPEPQRSALDAVTLPDARLYDHNHAIEAALQRHDRAAARRAFEELEAAAPGDHYLLHQARRAIASYDGDERGALTWLTALRERHAEHPWLRMCELGMLHGHASDERRAALATGLLAEHRDDAAILVACGRFLLGIGETIRARAAAHRALHIAPQHAPAYQLAADIAWGAGERARATRLYRIASCLAEGDEQVAWSYFLAAMIIGEVDAALAYLGERASRLQSRSGAPARTLSEAFAVVGRSPEAIAMLATAIAAHPDDGMLLLVAAEQHRLAGDLARAADHLERARGKSPDAVWRRSAAALAVHRGDLAGALALRRQLVEDDPLDIASQHAYVGLLARTGAHDAARSHVIEVCARFPFHIPLAQLCHDALRDRDPETARALLAAFLDRQPRSAWALQTLADWHARRGELAEARALLVRARACSDELAPLEVAEAALDTRSGKRDDAIAHLLAALRTDVDAPDAVRALLDLARDASEARALLETIGAELARQGSSGPGLLSYAQYVQAWYDPLTALERLRTLREARSYQWHAWSAEIDALVGAGKLDEAAALAADATQRFGDNARAWRQLAGVEAIRGDHVAQIAALERTLELELHAVEPMRRLADAYLAADDTARARAVIERALAEEPLDGNNHGYLARIAKLDGDHAGALRHLQRAIELVPEYAWAWERLLEWCDDERDAFATARAVLAREPAAITPRFLLARHAPDLSIDERLALLDDASRVAPDRVDLYDARAELLARHERWDDALAACHPPFWGDAPPIALIGRAAWVRFQRGEHEGAITDMLAAIKKTASYSWGIEHLLAWGKEVGAPVRTAERLVEVASDNAFAHAALGEARREAGDLAGAEVSFARALEIDGTQQLARLGLFDVRFEQCKYAAAEPLLVALDRDHPYVMARRVQLHTVAGRFDEADAELARMLRREVEDPTPLQEAVQAYVSARELPRLEALLGRLMAEPDAPRAVGAAWWKYVGQQLWSVRRWRRIKRWPSSPATRYAAMCHVEDYGERRDTFGLVTFTLLQYRYVRARTDLWGSVGYCLITAGHLWLTRWWLRDHERRQGVEPWMLNNLARALAALGAVTRAIAVCRRAIELPPDHATHLTMLFLAPIEALDDTERADRVLSAARRRKWTGEDRFLGELAEAMIAFCRSVRDQDALDQLSHALTMLWRRHRADASSVARRVFEYVTNRLARTLGTPGRRWLREMRRLPAGF
jgi:tetratricopeptide (TPR) repeat protein